MQKKEGISIPMLIFVLLQGEGVFQGRINISVKGRLFMAGKVYRKQRVEGMEIPAIIRNGNYFYSRLAVYEDGIIDCWHKRDLTQFKDDLESGRVVPSLASGQFLSIFQLGEFLIQDGKFYFNKNSYYRHVLNCVKKLNPEMKNIYQVTEREKKKWDKHRVSWSASATPCKMISEIGYRHVDGDSSHIFFRQNGKLYLTVICVYEDKSFSIEQTGEQSYTLEEVKSLFRNQTICTCPDEGEWVIIDGFAELLLSCEKEFVLEPEEKQKEILEKYQEITGGKTAHKKCIEAYHQYLVEPSEYARERLRETYEAVPEYERCYLGDMDTRDSDIIRILLFPEEKREV